MRPSLATSALLALAASTLVAAESGLRAFPAADLDFYEDGDFHRRLHCDVQSEQDCVKACKVDNGCEGATSPCTKVSYRIFCHGSTQELEVGEDGFSPHLRGWCGSSSLSGTARCFAVAAWMDRCGYGRRRRRKRD